MSQETPPEARPYTHQVCGESTVISGQPYEVLSNPLGDMSRTWCNTCNAFFPISDYAWTDTGEKITDYWARHSTRASSLERFLCSRKFLLLSVGVGVLLGAIGGVLLARNGGMGQKVVLAMVCAGVGAFIAAALNVSAITPIITRRVCGVTDTRGLQ